MDSSLQCQVEDTKRRFRDIAHPIHSEARANIQSAILERYQTMLVEEETVGAIDSDTEEE